MSTIDSTAQNSATGQRKTLDSAIVRFAGDSGDGMQVTGSQFTQATALAGNELATFPDFPAEIRAPVGTTFGVSAFQINFGSHTIKTSGDALDALVAMRHIGFCQQMPGNGVVLVPSCGSVGSMK